MAKVKFGIHMGPWSTEQLGNYNVIRDTALQCESLGYYSLWVMDHLTWGEGETEGRFTMGGQDVFEAWTLLSALSAETKRVKLGTMVICNSFRSPSLTAKIAASLDIISGGRLVLGYGAGWKEDEHEAYGFSFPKPSVRLKMMREGLIVIKKLWTEEKASFTGEFYRIKNAICKPKPVQKPHPPIIIAGGSNLALKDAVELGNGWNIWGASVEDYERKVNLLKKYCDKLGKRIGDIELSWAGPMILGEDEKQLRRKIEKYKIKKETFGGIICTFDECPKILQRYIDLGCNHFMFNLGTFTEEKEIFIKRIGSSF